MRECRPFPQIGLSRSSPLACPSRLNPHYAACQSADPVLRRRQLPGFTLVELLVVIGIIALVITMLLPALTKARQSGNRIVCASNLRSMGQGLYMYIADYKAYPGHAGTSQNGRIVAAWPVRLRKYAKAGRGLFFCPSQEPGFQWQLVTGSPGGRFASNYDADKWGYEAGELLLDVHSVPFSYGYNDWGSYNVGLPQRGLGADLWNPLVAELKASAVRKPAEMIAIADNTSDGSWDYNIDPTNAFEYPGKIHNNGANVLFCDGHVEWYLQSELILTPSTPLAKANRIRMMWNNDNKP